MSVGTTMKWVGRSARDRAEVVGHQLKDRALEKRLERTHEEAERLRRENDMLRDEVSESRTEHKKLFDLLKPKWLRIGGYWYPRGGMPIDVFWQAGKLPKDVWVPDQGVAPYRGRG